MKKSELRQIIREEMKPQINEGITYKLLDKYQNKTGPEGLIISKLIVLERVLMRINKSSEPIDGKSIIELVLKTFSDIRKI